MKPRIGGDEFESSHQSSQKKQDKRISIQQIAAMSDRELINYLYEVINDQQNKIKQFHNMLIGYAEKIRTLEKKCQIDKAYAEQQFAKFEAINKINNQLKIEIGLVRSDNLILKSRLAYQESNQNGQYSDEKNRQNDRQDDNQNTKNNPKVINQEQLGKQYQQKISHIRKAISKLLKILEKLIINNNDQENQIINQVSQIMKHLK